MTAETPCPVEARTAAETLCGPGTHLKLISNRRSSVVWQAHGPLKAVAVKVGTGPDGSAITARETTAARRMCTAGAVLAHGRGDALAWMVTPWYDGPSTWEVLHDVRAGTFQPHAAVQHMIDLCDAVAALHQEGWVHGDLQPSHAIHTADGVRFIDCSWSWHPDRLEASHDFRGGLPHLLAPELARSVQDGIRPVAPSASAEVYALAASLWWSITGDWPRDYTRIGIDPGTMTAPVLRQIIGTREIPLRRPIVWPGVQQILADALTTPAEHRPGAAEIARRLRFLSTPG
jgi:serine/threonine protein kinase